jgi:hypothetical protein
VKDDVSLKLEVPSLSHNLMFRFDYCAPSNDASVSIFMNHFSAARVTLYTVNATEVWLTVYVRGEFFLNDVAEKNHSL